jgi:polar amino acid transport system permease protein
VLNGEIYRNLLEGARVTLSVTGLAVLWGTVVAVVLGVVSMSSRRLVRGTVRVYVDLLRGVSAIILLFWVYYGLPLFGIELSPMQAGVLALGLNLSAFGTEIVRGAVQAVPRGQTEAAVAVNLSTWQRTTSIILPQAAVTILPPYGSLVIEVLKASSLVSLIALSDIMREGQVMRTGDVAPTIDIFTAVLIVYFAISLCITAGFRLLERYFGRGRRVVSDPVVVTRLRSLARGLRGGGAGAG